MSSRLVFLSYALLALVLTWPLALGLGSDVPGDLGDSLLNMWILGWGAAHVPRLLTGSISCTNAAIDCRNSLHASSRSTRRTKHVSPSS